MKKNLLKITLLTFVLGSILLVLPSCASKVPFNNEVIKEYELTPDMIKGLQFYLSKDVDLRRAQHSDKKQKTDRTGNLVISSASSSENISIPKGTEGICLGIIDGNKLKVSFESDDSKYLIFGDPKNVGRYTLMAEEWQNSKGKLQYGDKEYQAQPGSSTAYLIIKMKTIKKYKKNSHVVGGRKVNQ